MILDLSPAQEAFRRSVEEFAREVVAPRAAAIDESGEFPTDILRAAAARGLCGITIPGSHGGLGLDHVSYVLAIEALARASATVAASLSVTNSLVAEVIASLGSARQRDRWLHPLTSGTIVGAFALSEADAGTDVANQRTSAATISAAGPNRYRISGRKVWVANAEAASVALVFAATRPGQRGRGITAFLVPLDGPGVTGGARADSVGLRGLGCLDLEFDVEVDGDHVMGPVDEGLAVAAWALQGGRLAVAAQALGVGQAALDEAIAHAKRRETFGGPIAGHQAIQWMIADAATRLEAARLLTYKAAASRPALADPSQGRPGLSGLPHPPGPLDLRGQSGSPDLVMDVSMAKLAASQAARAAGDAVLQILASAGYRRGSTADRLVRDARAMEIDQGTSEAQRMIIAAKILGSMDGADRHLQPGT